MLGVLFEIYNYSCTESTYVYNYLLLLHRLTSSALFCVYISVEATVLCMVGVKLAEVFIATSVLIVQILHGTATKTSEKPQVKTPRSNMSSQRQIENVKATSLIQSADMPKKSTLSTPP